MHSIVIDDQNKMRRRNSTFKLFVTTLFVFGFLILNFNFVFAAELLPPTFGPTGGNVDLPLTVSLDPQWKAGLLVVGDGYDPSDSKAIGFSTVHGRAGIGTGFRPPVSTLEVATDGGGDGIITAKDFCFTKGGCVGSGSGNSGVGDKGVANFLTKWTSQSTLGTSLIYTDNKNVGIGTFSDTKTPQGLLHIDGSTPLTTGGSALGEPLLKITRDKALDPADAADRHNAGIYVLTRDEPLNVDVYDTTASSGVRPAFAITADGGISLGKNTTVADSPTLGTLLNVDGVVSANGIFSAGDVVATRFCFPGTTVCLTSSNATPGVTSVTPALTEQFIKTAPPAGTGNVKLSLDVNSPTGLVAFLKSIFQQRANNPANPTTHDYVCDPGFALNTVNADGTFDPATDCEPVGSVGGLTAGTPATPGMLTKFQTNSKIVDSDVGEVVGFGGERRVGVGSLMPQAKLDVRSLSGTALKSISKTGIYGKANKSDGSGVSGADSGISSDSSGIGISGVSDNNLGKAVSGEASGGGATAGYFNYSGTDGYALETSSGPVFLQNNVGIGANPHDNPPNNISTTPLKLRVLGTGGVGAEYYCGEDGEDCFKAQNVANFWTLNPTNKAIYNNNNNNNFNGVVAIGRPSANISTVNKLDVFTGNAETVAVKGESSKIAGKGIRGSATNIDGHGVEGIVTGTSGAVAGYFSAEDAAAGTGYALFTNTGVVRFGQYTKLDTNGNETGIDDGIVGIGEEPARWPSDATRKSVQLRVRGNVGAAYYCDEDGTGCVKPNEMRDNYWLSNSGDLNGDIYNANLPHKVGIETNGLPPRGSLDVRGSVYVDSLSMKTSAGNATPRCAPTWEEVARIMFQ